jgi:ribonuclease J
MLAGDFQGQLPQKTLCLYSRWTGYLDRPDWQTIKAALHQAQGKLVEAHTSGHIYAEDIADFIRTTQPKILIPIHTFEPERFSEILPSTILPRDGEPIVI